MSRAGTGVGAWVLVLAAPLIALQAGTVGAQDAPGRAPPQVSCGALLDATGAKVNRQTSTGAVGTYSTRRCPADARTVKAQPPTPEPIPELSAQAPSRLPLAQDGPLRYAAENPERVGAALVTGGAMIWALQSGLLTSVLLLGVPLWRHVDLLPIVASSHAADAASEPQPSQEDEAAVADVLEAGDAGSRSQPGAA